MLEEEDTGDHVVVRGRVTLQDGTPVSGAKIEVWQNGSTGEYACQQPGIQHPHNLRGSYRSNEDGYYEIRSVRPVAYHIPADGLTGDMLKAVGRNWWRPGHIHLFVTAPGAKDLITHMFDGESKYLDDDVVFAVRKSLIRHFSPDEKGELSATFNVVLDKI